MNTIRADAGIFQDTRPLDPAPSRALQSAGTTSWRRIAGLTLLAILGLFLGIVAGVLIVVSSGLVEFC